ncbi:uncharacterized protein EAF01_000186 [Botrytis porri]|uniref:Cyanovirin-N domain-containing protein n=1 Tax=Botrytis porri TaxID=87229 RepID=A0A4Z1KC45_9HELO|nr:uncharacterized protein EAF01_000186 [Botrytis porri]KAF7913780.1 hypothetical protein EAF01_000186 [Botrytis porri]TGO81760.1 hypothetical protein BPOR_1028g00020 [Botrytis porri]
MQFPSIIISSLLAFTTNVNAWSQNDDTKVWTAGNNYTSIRGSVVHEACTEMNTQNIRAHGTDCAYWTNGVGGLLVGKCNYQGNSVLCISGC